MLPRKIKVRVLLDLNADYEITQYFILALQISDLLVKMPVNGLFNRLGAYEDRVLAGQRSHKAQTVTTEAPQNHGSTWLTMALWHGLAELLTVVDLVTKCFAKKRDQRDVPALRDP